MSCGRTSVSVLRQHQHYGEVSADSLASISHYLRGLDFPARKQDLMRHARNNGADSAVMEVIEAMPDADYENTADVMKGYGEADNPPRGDGIGSLSGLRSPP